jgi:hypothetical protein
VAAALNQIVRHKHNSHDTTPSFIPLAIWFLPCTRPHAAGLSFCPFSFTKQFFSSLKLKTMLVIGRITKDAVLKQLANQFLNLLTIYHSKNFP